MNTLIQNEPDKEGKIKLDLIPIAARVYLIFGRTKIYRWFTHQWLNLTSLDYSIYVEQMKVEMLSYTRQMRYGESVDEDKIALYLRVLEQKGYSFQFVASIITQAKLELTQMNLEEEDPLLTPVWR